MKKVLFVGDSPECPSGFGRATREILGRVHGEKYDVTVLGINHLGDPGTVPYDVYTAAAGGDAFGIKRLTWICDRVKPDVIIIQQDGWYFPYYFAELRKVKPSGEYEHPEAAAIPVVGAVAIDGKNFRGEWIKDLDLAVFWTQFAYDEARRGGYAGQAKVIPLGVNRSIYHPVPREGAMDRQRVSSLKDKFVVGTVNRNQPRKRWDLTLRYFAEWVHSRRVEDARLYLHAAPTGDASIDVVDLVYYYNLQHKVVLYEGGVHEGKFEADMCDTYNCFDVCISTSQGEGFGLTTLEAMACRVPCIVPDWAALGDWANGAAAMVPCTSTTLQSFNQLSSIIGGVADQKAFVEALDTLYRDKDHRAMVAELGFARAAEARFEWDAIGDAWIAALDELLSPPAAEDDLTIWRVDAATGGPKVQHLDSLGNTLETRGQPQERTFSEIGS